MEITLTAEAREGAGKNAARRLRAAGKVPGVVYGEGGNPTPVSIDRRALAHALATDAGLNVLIDLKVGNDTYLALARELQRDPLRGDITHVDLLRVSRDNAIEADVPVVIIGNAPGVKEGGVVEHHIWSIRVSAKPADVPQQFEADISSLGLHGHLRVADLQIPAGVEILSDPDEAIVSIATPAALKLEAELDQPDVAAETAAAEGAPAAESGSES
ncbi:MAG: 50S ribosomal protein L25/general stress protein Ctc [Actinomycetota bacterium]